MKTDIPHIGIRRASGQDLALTRKLFCDTIGGLDKEYYTGAQIKKLVSAYINADNWKQSMAKDHFLVAADQENNIYGFCSLQPNGCISVLYVDPAHQKRGLAGALLKALYDLADNLRVTTLHANTNLAATSFFERNGFLVREVSSKEIDSVHFTNVLVDKRLLPA